jgi:hypothetical protein
MSPAPLAAPSQFDAAKMLSSAFTRIFVRSANSNAWAARALSSSSSSSLSLGFSSNVNPATLKSSNYALNDSLLLPLAEDTTLKQPVIFPLQFVQQHPSTPMFMGFSVLSKTDPMTCVETFEEGHNISHEPIVAGDLDEDNKETLQMMNRNARSSKRHKANHGKRPCNRNARRAKKIKLGRRRRT